MDQFLKSIIIASVIGLNPALFSMDQALQANSSTDQMRHSAQPANNQPEAKIAQAESDAAQFAKEQESKRRSALQNALSSSEKPDFQLCKTALLCKKKLPNQLKRYACSFLDKQFYLAKSFKAHNEPFRSVITYTKPDNTWYILAVTLDGIAVKIDGETDEVVHVFDKFPEITAIDTHTESNGRWSIIIGTQAGQIAVYDGDECDLKKTIQNIGPGLGATPYPVSQLTTGTMNNGDWYIFATTKFPYRRYINVHHETFGLLNTFAGSNAADPNFANNTFPTIGYIENNTFKNVNILFEGHHWNGRGKTIATRHMNKEQDRIFSLYVHKQDLTEVLATHICNNEIYLIVKTLNGKIIIFNTNSGALACTLDFSLIRRDMYTFGDCSIATYNKGNNWYIALRTSDHKIRIFNGLTGALEKIISDTTNDVVYPLPIATHIQYKGNVDLVVTDENGQINIISEGPNAFEQYATQTFIPSLELPIEPGHNQSNPSDAVKPPKKKKIQRIPVRQRATKFSLLKKLVVPGIVATGVGIALFSYLNR